MSAKETGYKWSKFCWDDWRNDGALQSCDLATKGFWMDLLSLMFSSERQGYLQVNNQPMSLLYISKKTGVDKRTIEKKLKVLIENKVCSVDENGIIYSRRMTRETSKNTASLRDTSSKDTVSVREGSRKVPVNLQEENAENGQKRDALNKNRIDKNRKESPLTPQGEFNNLSFEDQLIVQYLQSGELQEFMVKHFKNHNPSAWRYWEKHRENKPDPQCEIIPLRVAI